MSHVYHISHMKLPGPPDRKIFQMQEQTSVNMGGFLYHQHISFKLYVYLGVKSNLFCSHFEFQI